MGDNQLDNQVLLIMGVDTDFGKQLVRLILSRTSRVRLVIHGAKGTLDEFVSEMNSTAGSNKPSLFPCTIPITNGMGIISYIMTTLGRLDQIVLLGKKCNNSKELCINEDVLRTELHSFHRLCMEGLRQFTKIGFGRVLLAVMEPQCGCQGHHITKLGLIGLCHSITNEHCHGLNLKVNGALISNAGGLHMIIQLLLNSDGDDSIGSGGKFYNEHGNLIKGLRCQRQFKFRERAPSTSEIMGSMSNELKNTDQLQHSSINFKGKVIIVTGAGAGLGFLIAKRLVKMGAYVVAFESNMMARDVPNFGPDVQVYIDPPKKPISTGTRILNTLRFRSKSMSMLKDNVINSNIPQNTNLRFINLLTEKEMVNSVIMDRGKIDGLINCSSVPACPSRVALSGYHWEIMHRHHLDASANIIAEVWPHMLTQKMGSIVNVAPMGPIVNSPVSYSIAGLSRAQAEIGNPYGIRVNSLLGSYSYEGNENQLAVSMATLLSSNISSQFNGQAFEIDREGVNLLSIYTSDITNTAIATKEDKQYFPELVKEQSKPNQNSVFASNKMPMPQNDVMLSNQLASINKTNNAASITNTNQIFDSNLSILSTG